MLGDNTRITNKEIPVLSLSTANFISKFSCILTNNLNFEGSYLIDICLYDDTGLGFFHTSIKKVDIFVLTVGKKYFL